MGKETEQKKLPNIDQIPVHYEVFRIGLGQLDETELRDELLRCEKLIDNEVAHKLEHKFQNNSSVSYESELGSERPLSAFYVVSRGKVQIFSGSVNSNGISKLHGFLCKDNAYRQATSDPKAVVRSGHIGAVKIPGDSGARKVALIDSISYNQVVRANCIEFFIAKTFLEYGILPITTDGFVVKLRFD